MGGPEEGYERFLNRNRGGVRNRPRSIKSYMRVLISGAGIAGPTLAYWLLHHGFTPTIIESAPRLRTGGYVIDFWGAGFDIAERMGIVPDIRSRGYRLNQVKVVDAKGKQVAGFPVDAFFRKTRDRYVVFPARISPT